MGFIDLHCHVLPGLDDGVKSLPESLELLSVLHAMGFETVYATPHQKAGQFLPTLSAIDDAYAQVKQASEGRPVTLQLGAENFWDEVLLERLPRRAQPTYTGGKAFLFEINPRFAPPRLEERLFQIRLEGTLPVMAHPERYANFWERSLDRYRAVARTAALVVDLAALEGAHGERECQAARKLVESGVAHAAASDSHSVADTRAANAGIAWIRKRLGDSGVTRLLADNPRRILNGELPD